MELNQDIINAAVAKLEPIEVGELSKMIDAFKEYQLEVSNLSDLVDGFETLAKRAQEQIKHIKVLADLETYGNAFETTATYEYIKGL